MIAAFTIPYLTGRRRQDSGLPLQQYGLKYEFLPVWSAVGSCLNQFSYFKPFSICLGCSAVHQEESNKRAGLCTFGLFVPQWRPIYISSNHFHLRPYWILYLYINVYVSFVHCKYLLCSPTGNFQFKVHLSVDSAKHLEHLLCSSWCSLFLSLPSPCGGH